MEKGSCLMIYALLANTMIIDGESKILKENSTCTSTTFYSTDFTNSNEVRPKILTGEKVKYLVYLLLFRIVIGIFLPFFL